MPRKSSFLLFKTTILLVVLLPTLSVRAASPSPHDFAYGCSLPVTDTTGLYAIELPLEVYAGLQQDDQGDLQVFNGAGQPVPQALRRHKQPQIPARQPVPFFPLPDKPMHAGLDLSVRVQRHNDGSIITIRRDEGQDLSEAGHAYLLDLSNLTSEPSELEIQWLQDTSHSMIALTISESSDLAHWRRLHDKVVLAELAYNGGKVSRRSFALPRSLQPYLRLECLDCSQPLRLTSVTAISGPTVDPNQWHWQKLNNNEVTSDQDWWRIEYLNPARFRVTALDLTFPQANTLARVMIESRSALNQPWRRVGSDDFYRLDLQGNVLTSPFRPCPANADRYWRLNIAASKALVSREQLPELTLGWQPDELVFLGRGPGPYTLAFGSSKLASNDSAQDTLVLTALQQNAGTSPLNRIAVGPITKLGGEQALQPQAPPIPWQRILLWMVLVAGVGLLAIMARSVYREMQRKQG